jgi:O-antigen ligase
MPLSRRTSFRSLVVPIVLFAFLLICLVFGGASRADTQSQVVVRLAAIVAAAVAALALHRDDIGRFAGPFAFLAVLIVIVAVQLVPLPPALWTAMPGRALFAEAATVAGIAQPWRPLSLTPDLTLNSLMAIVPAAAALMMMAFVPRRTMAQLLPLWIAFAVASALFGILQLAGGLNSPFYTYAITNPGDPVGLFANRNHQAMFLATAIPLTMLWAASDEASVARPSPQVRGWIGFAVVLLLIVLLLISGSRSGLGLMGVGLIAGIALIWRRLSVIRSALPSRARLALIGGAVVAAAIFVAALIANSKTATLSRLGAGETTDDLRFSNLPLTLKMAKDYFPFGSGFGSFDPMFRIVEPDGQLTQSYFNHAHNDLLELAITAGLPGLLLVAAFCGWWVTTARRAWTRGQAASHRVDLARAGAVVIGMMLVASLVDYPLRTPLASVFFAVAVAWMCGAGDARFTRA